MGLYEIIELLTALWAEYLFYYPLAMSIVWVVGAAYYYFRRERKEKRRPPVFIDKLPFCSVLIPAHNEMLAIENTVRGVLASNYPFFEVIVIDDGSRDQTPEVLRRLADEQERVRILLLQENRGKPHALRCGALASRGEIIVTIDADALLDPDALRWLVRHFVSGPRVGAVTGNPRVRNRTTLLAKIQVGEFSSIIGQIKRTQRVLGKVLTVSGVIAAFRKSALFDVGLWDTDMITDDINITWKLQRKFYDVRYEPNALCWCLVPETVSGLWRQRVRWAQGGVEVIRRHWDIWLDWRQRRLWPVYIEYVMSVVWSYSFGLYVLLALFALLAPFPVEGLVLIPDWKGAVLMLVCLVQFMVAMLIDRRYEKDIHHFLFWVIWYPLVYWLLTAFATIWATPRGLFRPKGHDAIWVSPDRGLVRKL